MVSSNKSPHIIHFDSILIFRLMVFCEMGLCIAQHRINSVKAIFFLSIHIQVNSLHSFFSIGFCCSMPGIFLSFLCSLLGRLSVLMFVVLCGFGMVFPFAFHFCSTYFGCASVSIYLYSLVFIFISLTLFGFYFFSGGRGGGTFHGNHSILMIRIHCLLLLSVHSLRLFLLSLSRSCCCSHNRKKTNIPIRVEPWCQQITVAW